MKKFVRILFVIALLVLGFLYVVKHPELPISQQIFSLLNLDVRTDTGSTQITGLVFVHDDRFTKLPIGGLEALREEPGGLADLEKCNANPADMGGMESCDLIQKNLDTFILGDYIFFYSGFSVTVLDMSTVSGHQDVLASGLSELAADGTYPYILSNQILINTTWSNRAIGGKVLEITGNQFANADTSRMFISFEGQDGYDPVLQIIFRKGDYLVKIASRDFVYASNDQELDISYLGLRPEIYKKIIAFREFTGPHIGVSGAAQEVLDYYKKNIASDHAYQQILQTTIANALDRFAIK